MAGTFYDVPVPDLLRLIRHALATTDTDADIVRSLRVIRYALATYALSTPPPPQPLKSGELTPLNEPLDEGAEMDEFVRAHDSFKIITNDDPGSTRSTAERILIALIDHAGRFGSEVEHDELVAQAIRMTVQLEHKVAQNPRLGAAAENAVNDWGEVHYWFRHANSCTPSKIVQDRIARET